MEVVLSHQMVARKRDRHAPVVPCELPDGIQFLYVDDRGRQRTIALEDVGAMMPARMVLVAASTATVSSALRITPSAYRHMMPCAQDSCRSPAS
jgi:hypothetical protein